MPSHGDLFKTSPLFPIAVRRILNSTEYSTQNNRIQETIPFMIYDLR
jgi:hypothetical protein